MHVAAESTNELVDRFAGRLLRRSHCPGFSLGLTRRGRRVFARGYGFRDREGSLPATPATVYGIASMTKSVTALAILRLEEDRRLKTSDPIRKHLPEFRTPNSRWTPRITLHHFLTHTSGLPPLPSIFYATLRTLASDPTFPTRVERRAGIDPDHSPIDTFEQLLEYLASIQYRPLGPPGQYFSYSNEAFGLLGAVVERVSGRSYESFVEEQILRPAGMRHSTFDPGIMFRLREVTTLYSYESVGGRKRLIPSQEWGDQPCLRATGSLKSNLNDLLSYTEIYRTGGRVGRERIVSRQSLAKMLRPHFLIQPGSGVYYGYGILVRPNHHGTRVVFHGGALRGVSSEFVVAPDRGVAGVVLANLGGTPSHLLLRGAVNAELGLPFRTSFNDVPRRSGAPMALAPYRGWYGSGEGVLGRIKPGPRWLTLELFGSESEVYRTRLRPLTKDQFVQVDRGERTTVEFARDLRGRVRAAFIGYRWVRRRRSGELRAASKGRMVW